MFELFSLKGKVAVITGASRGLGKPMAQGLAAAGAHVVLVARDEGRLNLVRNEIVEAGGEASVLPLDLADEEAIRAGIRRIADDLGRIDVCVSNAGIINWQPLLDSDVEGPFNIASGMPIKIADVISGLASVAGRPDLVRMGAVPAREEPGELTADVSRIRREL